MMQAFSFSTILLVGSLSALLLLAVGLRLIFAPENAQGKAATSRIKQLNGDNGHAAAESIVRSQGHAAVGRVWPVFGDIALLVRRAGLEGKEPHLLLGTLLAGLLLGAAFMVPVNGPLAIPLGLIVAAFGANYLLKSIHNRRVAAFTKQLPDALDLIMRGLRVGHPVNATIANVARTMPDPIGAEFRMVAEQISHGDYLTDAFNDMALRIGQEDVEYLAVAISIQHGTGGNLAEMLGTLSKVVRDRIIMRRRIKAISSEGRASAYILSALPLVIYGAVTFSVPTYYGGVSDDPMFRPIAIAIVCLVVANFLAMRKLVTFQF